MAADAGDDGESPSHLRFGLQAVEGGRLGGKAANNAVIRALLEHTVASREAAGRDVDTLSKAAHPLFLTRAAQIVPK